MLRARAMVVRAFVPVFVLGLAWPGESLGQASSVPVYVVVAGSGAIKVRIAAGQTAPCDASSNIVLFDGELRANDRIALRSPTWSVCVQHTYGGFRRTGWSEAVIVGPRCLKWSTRRCVSRESFVRLDLSTDIGFSAR